MPEHGVGCLLRKEVTRTLNHLDLHPRRGLWPEHPVHRAVLAEDEERVNGQVVGAVPAAARAGSSRVRNVR